MRGLWRAVVCGAVVGLLAPGVCGQEKKTWEMRVPPKTTPAPLVLEPAEIELGDMRPGEKYPAEVVIRNTGDETIVIKETRSTCWCAVTELSQEKIEPGGTVVLEGEIEAPDELGLLERHVYLFIEGYSQPMGFPIKGEVSRGIRVRTEPAQGGPGQVRIRLTSVDGEAFEVLSVGATTAMGRLGEKPVFVDGYDPEHDEARSEYVIEAASPMTSGGYLNTWVVIETDRDDAPVIDVNLKNRGGSARQRPPTAFVNERVYLGAVRAGELVQLGNTALLRGAGSVFAVESVEGVGGLDVRVMGGREADEGPEIGFGITVTRGEPRLVVGEVKVLFASGTRGSFFVFGRVVD